MMSLLSPQYNVDTTKNTDRGDYVTQIPPLNVAPFPAGTFVPADDVAPSVVWDSSVAGQPPTPPDGSSAGITALDNDTLGNIDFARSSRGPNAGETSTKRFWAYALGALDYVTFPGTQGAGGRSHAAAAHQHLHLLRERPEHRQADHQQLVTGRRTPSGVIKKYRPADRARVPTASSGRSC